MAVGGRDQGPVRGVVPMGRRQDGDLMRGRLTLTYAHMRTDHYDDSLRLLKREFFSRVCYIRYGTGRTVVYSN